MATMNIGTKPVGSIVKVKIDGTPKNFIIVHQGKPSDMYDESCNGTWLLMQDIYETTKWHNSNVNDYEKSDINATYLPAFYNKIDATIRSQIKLAKIPYRPGSGTSGTVNSGASGLPVHVFLLSDREVGYTKTNVNQYICDDGALLGYFREGDGGSGTTGGDLRIAKLNGAATLWWLRSPSLYGATYAWYVNSGGYASGHYCSVAYGARPAFIVPSSLLVSDDGTVSTNTAPTTPASITIPEKVNGGASIAVTWAASTDKESNLSGYKVERSTNGGSAWEQIYQGAATTTNDTVPFGVPSVQYRVKAYDAQGLESDWRNSAQRDVNNNTAPTAPPSITVPVSPAANEQVTISWAASSDTEGNLTGYRLERKHDSEEWEQIYQGADTTYTDTITGGWKTVQYRVKAYDSDNAESVYTTSETRTVDNNQAPVITCSEHPSGSDLGEKKEGFSINYQVSDPDGDTVTVIEAIDGVTKRSHQPESGVQQTFDITGDYFMGLLNGKRTITITAQDPKGKQAVHTLTFTKAVHELLITLKTPMEADALITKMVMSIARSIPEDAEFKVEVTNNGKDTEPTWEDATQAIKTGMNFLFSNQTAEKGNAFNFRITAKRGEGGQGGHIDSLGGAFE